MAKFDLTGKNKIDSSKAKLPLGSEPIGLAARLSLDLGKAYENPSLNAYMKAEEDRKALIQASIDKWNEPLLQNTFREYEKIINSPAFSMALEKPTSIQDYAALIVNSFDSKNYEDAKKTLEGFHPQMNTAYSVAQSALEQMQKTIASPSIESTLSQLPNLGFYESEILKAVESIANNENILDSSKILAGLGASLASDSLKLKMDDYSRVNAQIIPKEYPKIEIPQNPIIKQNVQLIQILQIIKEQNDNSIEQNTQLLTIQKSQQDMQSSLYVEMQQQNNLNEIVIEQLKSQNDGIETQVTELKRQNSIAASQISDNRKSSRNTMIVAIFSILLSAYASYMSYNASYEIYKQEKSDNDKDNKTLLETINDQKVETQKQDQLIKLIEEQNKYLKKLAEIKDHR